MSIPQGSFSLDTAACGPSVISDPVTHVRYPVSLLWGPGVLYACMPYDIDISGTTSVNGVERSE